MAVDEARSPPHHTPSACHRALGIEELLHATLSHLDVRDLLRCSQVSQAFRDTVLSSAMQQQLFLRAVPDTPPSEQTFASTRLLSSGRREVRLREIEVVGVKDQGDRSPCGNREVDWSRQRLCRANDALFGHPGVMLNLPDEGAAFAPRLSATLALRPFRTSGDMHSAVSGPMLLTQPPVCSAQVYWQFRDRITISATTVTIKKETALTWQDVLDTMPAQKAADLESRLDLQYSFVRLPDEWLAATHAEMAAIQRAQSGKSVFLERSSSPTVKEMYTSSMS